MTFDHFNYPYRPCVKTDPVVSISSFEVFKSYSCVESTDWITFGESGIRSVGEVICHSRKKCKVAAVFTRAQ